MNLFERLEAEKDTMPKLNPELVDRERRTRDGYLVRTVARMGRPITDEEWILLQNIL